MGLSCYKQTLLALTQIADHQDSHLPSELIFVQLVARLYCFVSLFCPWCVQDLAFTFFSTLSSYCHIISSVKVPPLPPFYFLFFFPQQPSHLDSYNVISSANLQRKHSTLLAFFFFFTLLHDKCILKLVSIFLVKFPLHYVSISFMQLKMAVNHCQGIRYRHREGIQLISHQELSFPSQECLVPS